MRVEQLFASHKVRKERKIQEKRSKEEDERKARKEKEKREKVMIEIENPSEGLCESRKNKEYLTTSLTSIVKKEPLKGECIGKYIVDYDYLSHLREVFLVFRTNSLLSNSDKCTFYVDSVCLLYTSDAADE